MPMLGQQNPSPYTEVDYNEGLEIDPSARNSCSEADIWVSVILSSHLLTLTLWGSIHFYNRGQ